ncbi:hypothetical protein Cni_G01006 [Canna indica]|uniref:Uncharacterized protein n=1 Tax=Canna indica TaxID=4628 RepID=A0AAQ3JPA7_9LILI|nr:hypothetical protein Cni_G01006 [Canna indica]
MLNANNIKRSMEYDDRSPVSPPLTPPPKANHPHRYSLTSCFRRAAGVGEEQLESPKGPRLLVQSPTSWFRSKAQEPLEKRRRCLSLASYCGKHRRRFSVEFGYDPLSYALNFDEGSDIESPTSPLPPRLRFFSSRLPTTPPRDGGGGGGGGGFDDRERAHGVESEVPMQF